MKMLLLFSLLLSVITTCFSQNFILRKKHKIRKFMEINVKTNTDTSKWIHKMVETDSTITDLVYDSLGKLNQENIYTFNKQKRCTKENYIFRCNCNQCFLLTTKNALSIKIYK